MKPAEQDGRIIYLLRHGETELNASQCLRGRIDVALNDTGRQQAAALGRLFTGVPLQGVIASPLLRARQTAEPVADAAGLTVAVDEGLNDRDYGRWAGQPRRAVEARFGSVDGAPGAESWQELTQRVHGAFGRIIAACRGPLAVVGHDAVNRALLSVLIPRLADDPNAIPQRTGCWNKLVGTRDRWRAVVLDACPGDGARP
jgi:broad specificity phosphatase PhoE